MKYRVEIITNSTRVGLAEDVNKFLDRVDNLYDIKWYKEDSHYKCYITYVTGGGSKKKKEEPIEVE